MKGIALKYEFPAIFSGQVHPLEPSKNHNDIVHGTNHFIKINDFCNAGPKRLLSECNLQSSSSVLGL